MTKKPQISQAGARRPLLSRRHQRRPPLQQNQLRLTLLAKRSRTSQNQRSTRNAATASNGSTLTTTKACRTTEGTRRKMAMGRAESQKTHHLIRGLYLGEHGRSEQALREPDLYVVGSDEFTAGPSAIWELCSIVFGIAISYFVTTHPVYNPDCSQISLYLCIALPHPLSPRIETEAKTAQLEIEACCSPSG